MSHIFKPKFLGGEFPLDTNVRISYKRGYIHEEEWGVCEYNNNGKILEIEINIPSFRNLRKETRYNLKFSNMFYFAICGHEDAHALQLSGNFTKLYELIEKITKKRLNKTKPKLWDSLWIPYKEQQIYLSKRFPKIDETAAEMAEIAMLLYKGYSKNEIYNFIEKETKRINMLIEGEFEKCPPEKPYNKNILRLIS